MNDILKTYDADKLPDKLRQVLEHWLKLRNENEIPLRSMFDPLDVPSLLPHLLMVEVVRGSGVVTGVKRFDTTGGLRVQDFKFRLVGTYIDERVKESYTGKRLSQISGKGPGSDVWNAYSEVEKDGKPKVVSLNYIGPADGIKKSWEIFLPFSANGERVDFILVLIQFD